MNDGIQALPDSKNVIFIWFLCWPIFVLKVPVLLGYHSVKFGKYTNWKKVTFLDSPGSIDYRYVFGFCRSSGSGCLLTKIYKTTWGWPISCQTWVGLGWIWFVLFLSLPSSAGADVKLAEVAEQGGKTVEHPKSKSTQPRFARRLATL